MYLTLWRLGKSKGPPKYFKRDMYRRLAWSYMGRKRNCYGISIRYVRRALQHSNRARSQKKRSMKKLWETRISAACEEHGVQLTQFMNTLSESNIALNSKVLADLAIYEPRTFESLCVFCKQRSNEIGLGVASLSPPSGVITRGML